MTTISDPVTQYQQVYDQARTSLPGKDLNWLTKLRDQAYESFATQGFPHRKVENWKYTNVNNLGQQAFTPAIAIGTVNTELLATAQIPDLDCYQIVLVNGLFAEQYSQLSGLPAGIIITSLSNALTDHTEIVRTHLNKQLTYQGQPFAALNTMFLRDGVFCYFDNNSVLDKPLHIIHLATGDRQNVMSFPRHLIVAGEHSQATLIESYHGDKDQLYFNDCLTEIHLHDHSQLTHYSLIEASQAAYHIAALHAWQQQHSRLQAYNFALSGKLIRNDTRAYLIGTHTQCHFNGFYRVRSDQHIDNHLLTDHQQPHGTSTQTYKGILDGNGHGVFNGTVIVAEDAQKSKTQQLNKNLLLSPTAQINTKPELQIFADDVQCTHGATVGQLDDKALFYLRSRGISEAMARRILNYAFMSDIIDNVELEPIKIKLKRDLKGSI